MVTNDQLRSIYQQATGSPMNADRLKGAKAFMDAVFDILPVRGHIDETNAVAFDAYELSGCRVEPTYTRPTWE